jgi:hypothetical protein
MTVDDEPAKPQQPSFGPAPDVALRTFSASNGESSKMGPKGKKSSSRTL